MRLEIIPEALNHEKREKEGRVRPPEIRAPIQDFPPVHFRIFEGGVTASFSQRSNKGKYLLSNSGRGGGGGANEEGRKEIAQLTKKPWICHILLLQRPEEEEKSKNPI